MAIPACGAGWNSDFDDCHYGIDAHCDQPAHHRGDHAGPVVWWTGSYEEPQDGVRLSWPPGRGGPHEQP